MFASRESTSSTICYSLHLLSINPNALDRLRAEHDMVFEPSFSTVLSLLIEQPNLLPYTTAVTKEVQVPAVR